ncbi:glutathione S-transferase family protein [Paraburkholderia phytofirmans]|uniref:Glutathione S-transferase n=1 Tax=Paraburkholderia phytofirmans OLGA172 TaxID=1417228 RepID=A0A160FUF4_9BURK|nr:glutathione S-transferase family protein [Paraburkholderia phytofirmans]ANB76879.1 glutathione S-transferase [Paraburkholderia phytofirmans OLGA172]
MIVYKYGYGSNNVESPDISPFVVKLETWLRMSGLPYETRTGNYAKMPKRKLPVVSIDGQLIADSSFIIEELQRRHPEALNDGHLSALENAQSVAFRALFESDLYFVLLYLRWGVDSNMAIYRPLLIDYAQRCKPDIPRHVVPLIAPIALALARRRMVRQAWEQGIGRHTYDEIVHIGLLGWRAVAELLDDRIYLLGDVPSTLDATGFAWVHSVLVHPFESPIRAYIAREKRLVAYHNRIWERWWMRHE